MLRINHILFPTDFSRCADQALEHAIHLAREYNAVLHELHAIVLHDENPHNPAHHVADVDAVQRDLQELANTKMVKAVEPYKDAGVETRMVQERGIASADVILDYARDREIDLIVMGTHGRRGLGHLFLGSVAEEVVRLAGCPVLTIREKEQPMAVQAMERILVPVDFSEHSGAALACAKEMAAAYGTRLTLLHIIEETVHPTFYGTGKTSILELRPDIVEKSREAMEKLYKEIPGPDVEGEFHAVPGRAAQDIVQFAGDRKADLIVIATHGLSGIQHLLLGSVTEKVVRLAPCPVLTVKAFGKSLIA